MGARGYRAKLAAYADYLASGRYIRDYLGFPTILVVASDNAAEERIARATRAVALGRTIAPPLLLTSTWRIEDSRNPLGLLGPIWREPSAAFPERRRWLQPPLTGSDDSSAGGTLTPLHQHLRTAVVKT